VAEEQLATKAYYVRAGLFKDVDIVLGCHVGDKFSTAYGQPFNSSGLVSVQYFFHGKAAHAVDRRETKRINPMLRSLAAWHVLHYENDEFTSDWHWDGESPRGPIVRLLARKPGRR